MENQDRQAFHLTDEDYEIFASRMSLRGAYKSADRSDAFTMQHLEEVRTHQGRGAFCTWRDTYSTYNG